MQFLTVGQTGRIDFPDYTSVPDNPQTNRQITSDLVLMDLSHSFWSWCLMIASGDDGLVLANGDVGRTFTSSNLDVTENTFILSDFKIEFGQISRWIW